MTLRTPLQKQENGLERIGDGGKRKGEEEGKMGKGKEWEGEGMGMRMPSGDRSPTSFDVKVALQITPFPVISLQMTDYMD